MVGAILHGIGRTFVALEDGLAVVGALSILVLMALTTIDVVLRYVFNAPLNGAFEVSEFMMAGAIFLGIAYVQRHRGHVAIDFLLIRFPPAGQLVLRQIGYLFPLFVFAVITWGTGRLAYDAWRIQDYTSGAARLPSWPARSAVTLGCGMFCIRLLVDAVTDTAAFVREWRK